MRLSGRTSTGMHQHVRGANPTGPLASLARILEQYGPRGYSLCAQSFQHTINMTFKVFQHDAD